MPETNPASSSLKPIVQRLNVIVNLLLERKGDEERSVKEKILLLRQLGLPNVEIAQVLGISDKHVGKEISIANKRRREK